jgi:hypothetical protein
MNLYVSHIMIANIVSHAVKPARQSAPMMSPTIIHQTFLRTLEVVLI